MKVLFASAAAAVLLTSAPALAQGDPASATAGASATVVRKLTIMQKQDMNFGTIVSTAAGGTVHVDAAGVLTSADGLIVPGGNTGSAAKFLVEGGGDFAYTPVFTGTGSTITLAGGMTAVGHSMTVDLEFDGADSARSLGVDQFDDLFVTGTLNVGAGQMPGSYTGTINVQVAYD